VTSYVAERLEEKAANATINRELAALKRAFKLAHEARRVALVPVIRLLPEDNARQGFIEHADFIALRDALPERLRDCVTFLYLSGWRVGEMKALEWRDLDRDGRAVRLPRAKSKNRKGRVLPLSGELRNVIDRARKQRRLDCPFIFHRHGRAIKDFRTAWNTACHAVGLGKLLVHDLRRTVVRNLVRAGISDKVAMDLTGHKTRSVFDRYDITSERDLLNAVERRDKYLGERQAKRKMVKLS
jgi:integrase